MATNELTTLRNALATILQGDSALVTLMGYNSFFITWRSIADARRPALAYLLSVSAPTGGTGHRRRVQVLFGAYAQGNGAQDKVEAMTRRVREVLTPAALAVHNIDGEVLEAVERTATETEDGSVSQDARHDLDLLIRLSAPL